MPCSFALCRPSRSGRSPSSNGSLGVTVIVRWIPLVTAACGTQMARPVRTTIVRTRRGRGFQLDWRVKPILGDHASLARAAGSRQSWSGHSTAFRLSSALGREVIGAAACDFCEQSVTAINGPAALVRGRVFSVFFHRRSPRNYVLLRAVRVRRVKGRHKMLEKFPQFLAKVSN
jgi:hypothetical protein